jgi:hypothetical protein
MPKINDIPSSALSHNNRVYKLFNKMKDAQTRFKEAQKGIDNSYLYAQVRGGKTSKANKIISLKYDDYMENLKKKEKL